jgi:hypothetical protein
MDVQRLQELSMNRNVTVSASFRSMGVRLMSLINPFLEDRLPVRKIALIAIITLILAACSGLDERVRITSQPPTEAAVGVLYEYTLQVDHPRGLDVSFTLTGQEGMTLEVLGAYSALITWTPTIIHNDRGQELSRTEASGPHHRHRVACRS